jgi:hypothetical protein
MSRQSDMTPARFDALKVENARIAAALGLESERLTVALESLHKLLAMPPPDDTAMPFYFAMRDIAREGLLGKQ